MGEEDILAKAGLAAGDDRISRDAAQRFAESEHLAVHSQRNQAGAGLDDRYRKSAGGFVSEAAGADLGNRESPGCYYQCGGSEGAAIGLDSEFVGTIDLSHSGIE